MPRSTPVYHRSSYRFRQEATNAPNYSSFDVQTTSLRLWPRPMDMTTGMAVSWDDVKAYCRQNNIPFIKCLCDAKIKIFRPITGDHEGRYIGMCDARRKRDRCGFFIPIQDIDETLDYIVLDYLDPGNAIYLAPDHARPLSRFPIIYQPPDAAAGFVPRRPQPPPPALPAPAPFPMPLTPPLPPRSPTPEPEPLLIEAPPVAQNPPSIAPPPFNSLGAIFLAGLRVLQPELDTEQCRLHRAARLPDVEDPGFNLEKLLKKLDEYSWCFGCKTTACRHKMDAAHFRCAAYTCALD